MLVHTSSSGINFGSAGSTVSRSGSLGVSGSLQ